MREISEISLDILGELVNAETGSVANILTYKEIQEQARNVSLSALRESLQEIFPCLTDADYKRILARKNHSFRLNYKAFNVVCLEFVGRCVEVFECSKTKPSERDGFLRMPLKIDFNGDELLFLQQIRKRVLGNGVLNDNCKSFYFYGDVGHGKTTLLTAIAAEALRYLDIKVRFITMPQLVRLITSIDFDDKKEMSNLRNCDILFVDDLGQERYTTDNQESLVRDFFAVRYSNLRAVVLASNADIRNCKNDNMVYYQLSDYFNDSKVFECYKYLGKSRRK